MGLAGADVAFEEAHELLLALEKPADAVGRGFEAGSRLRRCRRAKPMAQASPLQLDRGNAPFLAQLVDPLEEVDDGFSSGGAGCLG